MAYAFVQDGIVANVVEAAPEVASEMGLVRLAEGAAIGWRYQDGKFTPPAASAPDPGAIDAERDRRLAAGMTFADHVFQSDDASRERIDRSRISAMAAIMGGAQKGDLRWHGLPVDFFWIAADDTRMPMDAQTMVAFGNAMAAREGLLIVAGNDLKQRIAAGETIADIGGDALWPAA